MMVAFFYSMRIAERGAISDYLLAGFFVGAAFNLKYNGLAVGIAIPVAHYLSPRREQSVRGLLGATFFLSMFMVAVGILATNPFMILDHKKFISDFLYNYKITPVYGGTRADLGYFRFIAELRRIFGVPGCVALAFLFSASMFRIVKRKGVPKMEHIFVLVALSVAGLYYAKFGSFTRTPARFVLPVTPFILMACAPCLSALAAGKERTRRALLALLVPVFLYNVFCSYYLGERFKKDPRLGAVSWLETHLKPGFRVESNEYSPHWSVYSKLGLHAVSAPNWTPALANSSLSYDIRMPDIDFESLNVKLAKDFKDSDAVKEHAHEVTPTQKYFTEEALEFRNPDVITLTNLGFGMENPDVNRYYRKVVGSGSRYELVYNQTSDAESPLIYPHNIDFLDNTIKIYVRKPQPVSPLKN